MKKWKVTIYADPGGDVAVGEMPGLDRDTAEEHAKSFFRPFSEFAVLKGVGGTDCYVRCAAVNRVDITEDSNG